MVCISYKWNHIVDSIIFGLFGPILSMWDSFISLGLVVDCWLVISIICIYHNLCIYYTMHSCLYHFSALGFQVQCFHEDPIHLFWWAWQIFILPLWCKKEKKWQCDILPWLCQICNVKTWNLHLLLGVINKADVPDSHSFSDPPTTLPLPPSILSSSRDWDWGDMNRNEHSRSPAVHMQYSSLS